MSNKVILSDVCCSIPPVKSEYTPIGTMEKLEGYFDMYCVGPKDTKKAIIVFYDIFGFHPNTQQVCDIIANNGFRVVMPNFLPYKPEMSQIREFIETYGKWEKIEPGLNKVIEYLKKENFEHFGVIGFCWGGKMAALSSHNNIFSAVVIIHPSMLESNDAEKSQCPWALLPSKNEPDLTFLMDILNKKSFGSKCFHKRFDDMHHGWCAARGNWNDPLNAQRANEAIQIIVEFLVKNV